MYLVRVSRPRRPWPTGSHRFPRLGDRVFVTALALSVCSVLAGASLAPGVSQMAQALGAQDALWVRLLVSLPALGVPIGALAFARFSSAGRDRRVLQAALIAFAVCGVAGAIEPGAALTLAMRFMQGVAIGPIMLIALRLLNAGADPRGDLGVQAAVMTGSTVLILLLSGAAGALAWQAPFMLNLAPLALLPLVAGLSEDSLAARPPKGPRALAEASGGSAGRSRTGEAGVATIAALLAFLAMACFYAIPTRMADFLSLQGVESTFAVSGVIIASVLGAAVGGLLYRRHGASLQATLVLAFAVMFVGVVQIAYAGAAPVLLLGAALTGLGFGGAFPALNHAAGSGALGLAPEKASAMIVAAFHVGQFASPVASAGAAAVAEQAGAQALFLPYAALAFGALALIALDRRSFASMAAAATRSRPGAPVGDDEADALRREQQPGRVARSRERVAAAA